MTSMVLQTKNEAIQIPFIKHAISLGDFMSIIWYPFVMIEVSIALRSGTARLSPGELV